MDARVESHSFKSCLTNTRFQEYVSMRMYIVFALAVCFVIGIGIPVRAHGPQIQLTADSAKIVTRELILDDPYSDSLTDPKSVYAMPLAQYVGVWQSHPNDSRLPDNSFEFPSGPGFAYGYGYHATTNPEPFPVGSKFILGFTKGLKSWNGTTFVDAGATELEAYRGSSAAPSALAKTSDTGPFASLMFPGSPGVSFTNEGADTHTSVSHRMLGDGTSTASPLADGVYLVSLQLSSTSTALAASDPFYFVLSKNGGTAVQAAIDSLGFDASRVENLVPEPATASLALCGVAALTLVWQRYNRLARS
jgi:hypothetical protein